MKETWTSIELEGLGPAYGRPLCGAPSADASPAWYMYDAAASAIGTEIGFTYEAYGVPSDLFRSPGFDARK